MSETSLIPIATKAKINEALEFFHLLKEVKFTNDGEYNNGVELCKSVKSHIKVIDSDRKVLVTPFNEKVSTINGECNGVINKLKNAETVLKNGMTKYYREKEQKRIAEQKRLDAEVEEQRRQQEAKAAREAEKEDKYREEGRDKMADNAAARVETAQVIASTITAPIVTNTAKVAGTSFTKVYKAELTDKKAAIEHMLMNNLLIQYLTVDIKGIEKLAKAQRGTLDIEGIRITESSQVSIRS